MAMKTREVESEEMQRRMHDKVHEAEGEPTHTSGKVVREVSQDGKTQLGDLVMVLESV